MSQHVPSGKLIDIDGSFDEELSLLEEDHASSELTTKPKFDSSSPTSSKPSTVPNEAHKNLDDDNVPTFDVSFSSATFAENPGSTSKTKSSSRWSQSASVGGTILNNPAFKSDFNSDYLLWSKVSAQEKKLSSSSYSLTSSIVNIIGGSGGSRFDLPDKKSKNSKSKYSLDSLLSSSDPKTKVSTTSGQLLKGTNKMTSTSSNNKYRPTENWSMSSLNSAGSGDKKTSAYGETQRLVDQGSATRLIVNDDEDYDSADGGGSGAFGGFRRGRLADGIEDEDGKVGSPCSNWSLYKGIFYSSLSSVFFSLSAVIVKYLKVSFFILRN